MYRAFVPLKSARGKCTAQKDARILLSGALLRERAAGTWATFANDTVFNLFWFENETAKGSIQTIVVAVSGKIKLEF